MAAAASTLRTLTSHVMRVLHVAVHTAVSGVARFGRDLLGWFLSCLVVLEIYVRVEPNGTPEAARQGSCIALQFKSFKLGCNRRSGSTSRQARGRAHSEYKLKARVHCDPC